MGAWRRTGKSFFHGGFVQVRRFYGSVSPGPNSHFYTASDVECNALKALPVKPMPADRQHLNYEGIAVCVPQRAPCLPLGSACEGK
jgi:hypothetical protein